MLKAIADLHLSLGCPKPMGVFGEAWENHHEKLQKFWHERVSDGDTVVINGDISWAMKPTELAADITFLRKLPGKKIISLGNHDYWFESAAKLGVLFPEAFLLARGSFTTYRHVHICGTKGYATASNCLTAQDKKLNSREQARLESSLNAAVKNGAKEIYVFLHYPPLEKGGSAEFMDIVERYPVTRLVYGHLHGATIKNAVTGFVGGIELTLDSADAVGFKPLDLLP